jgi:hypothetical protein
MLFLTGKKGSQPCIQMDATSRFLHCACTSFGSTSFGRNDRLSKKNWSRERFHRLGQQGTGQSRRGQASTVADLARFFPEATPVRIPVQFTRRTGSGNGSVVNGASHGSLPSGAGVQESTVIEFGTAREVLFACSTPLEFADILRLRNSDGSLDTEASVVAVQYHPGKTIVAARFTTSVPNWIVKP